MSSLHNIKSTTDVSQSEDMALQSITDSRRTLNDLISQMPNELPLVEGWDEMPAVGLEQE